MDHTLCCAKENFLEGANLGSSKGFALGSHPNLALQLSHVSSTRNTPRKVTMSLRLKKGPAVPTLAHEILPSFGIISNAPASGASLPHGALELPFSPASLIPPHGSEHMSPQRWL